MGIASYTTECSSRCSLRAVIGLGSTAAVDGGACCTTVAVAVFIGGAMGIASYTTECSSCCSLRAVLGLESTAAGAGDTC